MPLGRTNRKRSVVASAALAAGAFTALLTGADEARADGPVTGTGKGIAGGALLGGEVATITMAIIGVEAVWPYFAIGGAAAVGGGIGGYFVETAAPAEVPLYMLAGGMALVIPTLVAALNATAYKPPEEDVEDPSATEPAPIPPSPSAQVTPGSKQTGPSRAKIAQPRRAAPFVPMSLVGIRAQEFKLQTVALGIPAVDVRPLHSLRERQMFGVEQGYEVRVPLFRAMF
ncbi:MAG: hypothetical protein L6Q76_09160 [Polyangiaceae bacterium]|nr:hypothetical protein [Polyangiaceae bacterium]